MFIISPAHYLARSWWSLYDCTAVIRSSAHSTEVDLRPLHFLRTPYHNKSIRRTSSGQRDETVRTRSHDTCNRLIPVGSSDRPQPNLLAVPTGYHPSKAAHQVLILRKCETVLQVKKQVKQHPHPAIGLGWQSNFKCVKSKLFETRKQHSTPQVLACMHMQYLSFLSLTPAETCL
jgi:hypothetical protein